MELELLTNVGEHEAPPFGCVRVPAWTPRGSGSRRRVIADPELRQLVERNFEDEQRHITWLATQARPSEDEEPMATGEN